MVNHCYIALINIQSTLTCPHLGRTVHVQQLQRPGIEAEDVHLGAEEGHGGS